MLIAEAHSGVAIPLAWRTRITRLGEGIAEGRLRDEAVRRTIDVLREYADEARRERVQRVSAVATSAVRDAENAGQLLSQATALNLPVEVLSGDREAALTHLGASADSSPSMCCLVIDIGGGSTELVLGVHGHIERRASLNLGCVRMTEQYPMYDPPLREQVDALMRIVMETARPVAGEFAGFPDLCVIAVAGTATTLAALRQQLQAYDPERVHGFRLSRGDVADMLRRLSEMTLAERRQVPSLEPERADIIVAGAAILLGLMNLLDLTVVTVSEHGILYGLALELAEETRE